MNQVFDRLRFRGDLSELGRLFAFVEQFCARHGLRAQLRHDLLLIVEELVINVIEHGYVGTVDGPVEVTLCHRPAAVEMTIEDEAPPFDPLRAVHLPDTSSGLEDRPIGGLGVHLVKSLTQRCVYRYEGGRNIVSVELDTLAN